MDDGEMELLLAPDDDPDSITLSREERKKLWREYQDLRAENERLRKIEADFHAYKKRHPETVGVKHGKAYVLRSPAEPRPSGGRPGARPGHPPHLRPRPDHIDQTVRLHLDRCPECHGGRLSEVQATRTRLVEDLPEPHIEVTEYTVERRYCRDCRRLVESPVPGVLPGAQLGLRAMHAIVEMRVEHRMTIEQIPPLLESLYGLKVSEGEVHGILAQMAEAYTPVVEGFRAAMRTAPAKYLDETPWWLNGQSAYLWVAATAREVIYAIRPSRGHEVALEMLGTGAKGTMVHDRYVAYETVARKTNLAQQLCWFHLLGDSKELVEFLGEEGRQIHEVMKAVYQAAKRVAGQGTEKDVEQLWEALEGGLKNRTGSSSRGERFVTDLLAQRGWMFEFVVNPAVEGTNNRAERALRPMVVSRKIFGGNRSGRGARVFEVLASVVQTLRLRGQSLMANGPSHLRLASFG
jgi:transposase